MLADPDRRKVLTGAVALAAPRARRPGSRPLFSIGAVADCQYADEDDNGQRMYRLAPAKLAAAVEHFNRLDLHHVVHLGDFIDRDWASFDALQPIVDRLRAPWRFVLGNHEFAVADDLKPRLPTRLGMPARYYSFSHLDWDFLVLDGADLSEFGWPAGSPELAASQRAHRELYPQAPDWDGGIGGRQLAWIEAILTSADQRGRKAALYCHFPAYPENPHNLWNAADVIGRLERHPSVKLWLNGHNHDGNSGEKAGIQYVNLKAMLDTAETAYAVLDVHADRIQLNGFGRQPSLTLPL